MRATCLIVVILVMALSVFGDVGIIKVDIEKGTVDPVSPVVNVAAADAIQILVVKNDVAISNLTQIVKARLIAGSVYQETAGKLTSIPGAAEFTGNPLTFNTTRCSWRQSERERRMDRSKPGSDLVPCPATIISGSGLVTLHAADSTITIELTVLNKGEKALGVQIAGSPSTFEDAAVDFRQNIPIQLVARGSQLFWSAGLTWMDGIRDDAYHLRPITGDSANLAIVSLGEESAEYRLGANAHYRFSRTRPVLRMFSAMFGLATTIPTEDLGAYLGVAISPPVWPFDDGGHLFIGYGYSKAARLANQFVGVTTVPSSTNLSDLTADKYDYGLVFGVSFTFFGGKDKFKAAFPGQGAADEE